ncbi:hypothetical protein PTKIN_Ptkin09bG0027400 [Pterospermum kingtungense]
MVYSLVLFFGFVVVVSVGAVEDAPFQQNYVVEYGGDHIQYFNNNTEAQLSIDNTSGSGFGSKVSYGSGFFQMKIKLPDKDTTGIITTFYLMSRTSVHDEVDFEFLGGNGSYTLHTNVFANGEGGKEQQFYFWFDPTADFHTYTILWNEHQIVLFVDETPIRVFKNKTDVGIAYPTQPMQLQGTIWEADWARHGMPVDWSQAPFKATYQGFGTGGCEAEAPNDAKCHSPYLFWNGEKYWDLDPDQRKAFEDVRNKCLKYDYCSDKARYPDGRPECQYNK